VYDGFDAFIGIQIKCREARSCSVTGAHPPRRAVGGEDVLPIVFSTRPGMTKIVVRAQI
jgi:hypothetical protein